MPKNFYIADWHYGHKNIITYDNRPFESIEHMNAKLVENWNAAVSDEDTVYVLGDMFWCKESIAVPVLKSLNGFKVLIRGNHDQCKNRHFVAEFSDIYDYLELKDGDEDLVLCHYPIPFFKNHTKNWIHLYGHVHGSFEENMTRHMSAAIRDLYEVPHRMINVGAMMPWIDYAPRTLNEILYAHEEG